MVSAFLITLREGLEAVLIVGIVLSYLRQIGRRDQIRAAWAGVGVAALLSALSAVALRALGAELQAPFEQIFEGTTMLLAVVVLTWMVLWMQTHARFLKRALEDQAQAAVTRRAEWGLFSLTFLAVFREGLETALFLAASAWVVDGAGTLIGAVGGLAVASALGVLIYVYAVRLNLRLFFAATGVLLMIIAAGLLAHGLHEFQEIGWLPLTAIAWDTSWLLDHKSEAGALARALIGYTARPTWLEVAAYLGYWLIVWRAIQWQTRQAHRQLLSSE